MRDLKAMCASLPPLTDLPGFDVIPWRVIDGTNNPTFVAMYVKYDANVDPDPLKSGARAVVTLPAFDVERHEGHLDDLVRHKCETAIMSLRDLYECHGKPFPVGAA